jgi:hypothetical protein
MSEGDNRTPLSNQCDILAERKAPLAREVKPAPTLKIAEEIAAGMIEANIKKGWEPVVGGKN